MEWWQWILILILTPIVLIFFYVVLQVNLEFRKQLLDWWLMNNK